MLDAFNYRDNSGATPLFVAAVKEYLDCVKVLLAIPGIDVNPVAKNGNPAFMLAAEKGHAKILEELLRANTKINAVGQNRFTALTGAAKADHFDALKVLLDAGAGLFKNFQLNCRRVMPVIVI